MSRPPYDPSLLHVAQRVVWFQAPEATLANLPHFMAHVMTYGTVEDVSFVRARLSPAVWRACLRQAPAGVFDPRSWAYWHLMLGLPEPPMPIRRLSGR